MTTLIRNARYFDGLHDRWNGPAATGSAYELSRETGFLNPYPQGKIGILEPGAFADLLFLNADPLADLEVLCHPDNVTLVMKNGTVYKG